jgi:ABC-type multidrug transport system ATPase subunit
MKIYNIRKEFTTTEGNFIAVKGLSMDLYSGELVSLLGRNGAGKTTLISMLTGLFPPTSGDATIYGNRITSEMAEIRNSLGVCPQHDTVWEKLSVKDHLIVFAGIKGTPLHEIPSMVREMVAELKLEQKSGDWAGKLSGGQRRRLCKNP